MNAELIARLREAGAWDLAAAEKYLTPQVRRRIIDRVLREHQKQAPLNVAVWSSSI